MLKISPVAIDRLSVTILMDNHVSSLLNNTGPVKRPSTEEEVVARANDTEFGLAAYFFSRDVGRVMRVAENLEYGIVCSNSGVFSTAVAPFGGWKQSGIGSEGGQEGIADFYETKFHSMGGIGY